MTKGKSIIYWIILIFIIFGYMFFFTSRFFFHSVKNYLCTDINSTEKMSDSIQLTLKKWTYSKEDKSMLVMFDAKNTGLDKIDLNYSSYERHTEKMMNIETGTKQTKLDVDIIYPFENIVVVFLTNVSPEFEEVVLSLQLSENKENSENAQNNKIINFYTNKDKVECVDKISDYTFSDYRIEYLNIEKSDKQAKIKDLQEQNLKLESDNKNYEKIVEDLISNQDFETTYEIEETNKKIDSYKRQIENNNKIIDENNISIKEIKNSISEIDATIKKLKDDAK